ncbi:MAG: hypothetical protein P4N59_27500 [Negativicutes bacterium]|nr:hypothetical protein [Negativicutes bacterium]
MVNAEKIAAALLLIADEEVFVAGYTSDIQRLNDAGVVEQAWDFKLDNGHRPYLVAKKRINFTITDEPSDEVKNGLTQLIAAKTGVRFSHNLHLLVQTYLFRETAAFWGDIWADFAEDANLPAGKNLQDFYAVYRGCILPNNRGAKLIRL